MKFSEQLLLRLQQAKYVVAFTGAGMSAESGVPTFRGDDGLWKKFKPEELANFDAFIRNPDLVWEWYKYRKQLIATVQPNRGHYALAEMETMFEKFSVITQNIDNLHRRAGNRNVYELHGNIERSYCISCGTLYSNEEIFQQEKAPRCTKCQGFIRPDVVWFGEMLPAEEWQKSEAAARQSDVFFSIGTSSIVYPAAELPHIAQQSGSYVIEINIEPTELSHRADEVIRGKAGEVLPQLVTTLKQFWIKA
jgi:NAD-dependent deacetylase